MHDVVQARTAQSPAGGFALLQHDPWLTGGGFHAGVRGYLAALPAGSDWLEVRKRLGTLVPDRVARTVVAEKVDEQEQKTMERIDLVVAGAWAHDDLGDAVDWYAGVLSSDGWLDAVTPRAVKVLQTVPVSEMYRVVDWVDAQRFGPGWDDEVVVQFMKTMRGVRPTADFERLVSVPEREEDRAKIVAGFATPAKLDDGSMILLHPPETLMGMVRAAKLSAEETERWLRVVEEATWPES